MIVGIGRAVAFVMGAGFSLTVGQLGMRMAVGECAGGFGRAHQLLLRRPALPIAPARSPACSPMVWACWVAR